MTDCTTTLVWLKLTAGEVDGTTVPLLVGDPVSVTLDDKVGEGFGVDVVVLWEMVEDLEVVVEWWLEVELVEVECPELVGEVLG